MSKNYIIQFSNGNPTLWIGLSPTFTVFKAVPGGTDVTPPGITQIPTNTGLFYFTYGATSSIAFVIDGATTSLTSSERYITGNLDPADNIDGIVGNTVMGGMSLLATGITGLASGISALSLGVSAVSVLIGTTASSFGNTATDPSDLFGYLKRLQEWNEGNSIFNKSTSLWDIYSRGSSTLLAEKSLVDSQGLVTKS